MTKPIFPKSVVFVLEKFKEEGFEAFIVGGCVRDLLFKKRPKDWDITTNAKPKEILKIFPDGKYENSFGTVLVPVKYLGGKEGEENIEITTYRIESKYTDKRHPDEIKFAKTLEEDLSRRDFTANAMAMNMEGSLTDPFNGQKDLKKKIIKAVGKPEERFDEDGLRLMRAIRFAVQLDFEIEKETFRATKKKAKNLQFISKERVRDELEKIILSKEPARGIELLIKTDLITEVMPEVLKTVGVKQNRHHYYGPFNTVFAHMLASLDKCPSKKLEVRLAAFLHDIGKPQTKRGQGQTATFHGHEYVSAKTVRNILYRLKFPRKVIEKTVLLVKNHMFYYNVDEVGEAGVRRVIKKVGLENMQDLIDVRIADRLGSGVPKAVPYRLRHFQFMVDKVSQDAVSVNQLMVNGNDIIKELGLKPGPQIGQIMDILLAEVIEKPELNNKEELISSAKKWNKKELGQLRKIARQRIKQEQIQKENKIKKKHYVK